MPKQSKHPVIRRSWPKIIDYRDTAQKCLMLDARPHGKREYFKTVGEAKARADQDYSLGTDHRWHDLLAANHVNRSGQNRPAHN